MNADDFVEFSASGTVDVGGAFLGLGQIILGPEGDNFVTPDNYPARQFRKNSLIVGIRDPANPANVTWLADGSSRSLPSHGAGLISLAVNDASPADNSRGWSVVVTVTSPNPTAGASIWLGIARMELVQSMQRPDNSIPLIAGKRTLMRVFVNSGRSDNVTVPVLAEVSMIDLSRGRSTYHAAYGEARREGSHVREDFASSVNILLPNPPAGDVEFAVRIRVRTPAAPLPGEEAEEWVLANFRPAPVVAIQPFLIAVPGRGLAAPTESVALAILADAQQRLPLVEGRHVLAARTINYLSDFDGSAGAWQALLVALGWAIGRVAPSIAGERDYLHVGFVGVPASGISEGIGMYNPFVASPTAISLVMGNPSVDAEACAHEMGHALGLNHSLCGDPPWPWSAYLPQATEEPGWYASQARMVPAGVAEMMTYCAPRWPSIVAYEYVLHGRHI